MRDQPEIHPSPFSPERVKAFIEMLDKLYYEKPAGFTAYMATCQSHLASSFTEETAKPAKK